MAGAESPYSEVQVEQGLNRDRQSWGGGGLGSCMMGFPYRGAGDVPAW